MCGLGEWKRGVVLVLLPTVLQLLVVTASTAEIHCYCNTEECAPRGHKCRSQLGHCFSKMRFNPKPDDEDNSVHGCAESLPTDERTSCRGDSITRRANGDADALPILMCCTANMCNYIDKVDPPDVAIDVFTNETETDSRYNNNHMAGAHVPPGGSGGGEYSEYPDVWFRVAVIAVPVAGALILVLLVLTALRMLRHDSRRLLKRDESMAKAQLYVADHFTHAHAHSSVVYTENSPQSPCGGAAPCVEKGYDHIGYMQPSCTHDGNPQIQSPHNEDNTCVQFETETDGNHHPRISRNCDGMSMKSDYCLCSVQTDSSCGTQSDSDSPCYQSQRASLYKIVHVTPGTCRICGSDVSASWENAKRVSNLGPKYEIFCMNCALVMWRMGPDGVCYSVANEKGAKQTDSKHKSAKSQNDSCSSQSIQSEEPYSKSTDQETAISINLPQNHDKTETRDESRDSTCISCDQTECEPRDETLDVNESHDHHMTRDQSVLHDQASDEKESADEIVTCYEKLLPNQEL